MIILVGCMEDNENTLILKEFNMHEIPMSCTWIIIGPPGSGKCLGRGVGVLMADMTIKYSENIEIDDFVMGSDGTPRKVLGLSRGVDEMYEITSCFPNKSYTTNSKHILVLKDQCNQEILISAEDAHNSMDHGHYYWHTTAESIVNHHLDGLSHNKISPSFVYDKLEGLDVWFIDSVLWTTSLQFLCESVGYNIEQCRGVIKVIRSQSFHRKIDIQSVGQGEYFGFEIEGDGKFVLGCGVVTHNTTFIENMAYYLRYRYPVCRSFIGTEGAYKKFCKITHPLYVSLGYSEDAENKHIARQKLMDQENGTGSACNYAINIIDDASDDTKIYKTKTMKGLFKLGSQHWHQLSMLGTQYAIDMPPDIRKSVSYVAIFMEPEEIERRKLYTNFGGLAGSYDDFCSMMDQVTGDYTCLIFKKRTQSNKRKENIFWYKTKNLGDWSFGCQEYREWGEKRYNNNYIEKIM